KEAQKELLLLHSPAPTLNARAWLKLSRSGEAPVAPVGRARGRVLFPRRSWLVRRVVSPDSCGSGGLQWNGRSAPDPAPPARHWKPGFGCSSPPAGRAPPAVESQGSQSRAP